MPNPRDKVKFTIYSRTSGIITIITSRELADEFREEVMTNQLPVKWHEISGQLNHIDANDIKIVLEHDDITGFDTVELNQNF